MFFGPQGDTRWNQQRLERELPAFRAPRARHPRPARRAAIWSRSSGPSLIVHAAAQPSHDRAAAIPFDDFDTNAVGTLNLLEAARQACPGEPVRPHEHEQGLRRRPESRSPLVELETRWDYADPALRATASRRRFSIDQSLHSLFGASKVAADVMVQEYGRYFGMPTCCLRGGCLTGPNHSGVELHGFLSYLVQVQPRRARVPGLRLQGQAGARQHPQPATSRASSTRSPKRRAAARSTTSAAARRTPAPSSRRSRSSSGSPGRPQQLHLRRDEPRSATTSATTATSGRCGRTIRAGISRSASSRRSAQIVGGLAAASSPREDSGHRRLRLRRLDAGPRAGSSGRRHDDRRPRQPRRARAASRIAARCSALGVTRPPRRPPRSRPTSRRCRRSTW